MTRFEDLLERKTSLAVVGLGYVGLPLAAAFSRYMKVIGFDISERRIAQLCEGCDNTREVDAEDLASAGISYTTDPARLKEAGVIIVAVPTPIDDHCSPDLRPVIGASVAVGKNLAEGTVVVYESTVYPGLTEEVCVPLLERESGLCLGAGFTVGYSPERINPGDKVHTLKTIVKIVAGSDKATTDLLERLYGKVVTAGIHRASSIKVAEAAKVIENTQRDLNIALMNELAVLFGRMGIDTIEVLEAAGSKWNFLPFRPGLVGGHCIGVDPYYLTFKAQELGLHPEVILAGRRINDGMGKYVAECAVKRLIRRDRILGGTRVGILGFTFKENVPDLRNTRVVDIARELAEYGITVLVSDALAEPREALAEYGQELLPLESLKNLDALILAVPHSEYLCLTPEKLRTFFADPDNALLLDVKAALRMDDMRAAGFDYWRL